MTAIRILYENDDFRETRIVSEKVIHPKRGRYYLSNSNKLLGGVLGGVGDWLGTSPTVIRILYAFVSFITFLIPGLILYIVLWIVIPRRPK